MTPARECQSILRRSEILAIFVLAVCCLHGVSSRDFRRETEDENKELLYNVLAAIQRAADFFAEDFAAINVDGLFGIRLCQGSVEDSLKDCSTSNFQCPPALIQHLQSLREELSEMADKSMPYVEHQDDAYFRQFHETIDGPYSIQYHPQHLGGAIAPKGHNSSYNEEVGDKCFTNILGTYMDRNGAAPRCTVTDECTTFVTRGDTAEYVITHQLLYLIIGEKAGCLEELNARVRASNGSSVRELETKMCGHIYSEAKEEVQDGDVKLLKQDLFLEQNVLCGILGFRDFFSPSWIRMVLGWQRGPGCFGMPQEVTVIEGEIARLEEEQRHMLNMLVDEATKIDEAGPTWTGRKLMRERVMSKDCLAHKTGLAFGTLGTYLRHFIHIVYKNSDI